MNKLIIVIISLALFCCNDSKKSDIKNIRIANNPKVFTGTEKMIKRLNAIAQNPFPGKMWHQNEVNAKMYFEKARIEKDLGNSITFYYYSALEYLNAGNTEMSVSILDQLDQIIKERSLNIPKDQYKAFNELRAICYLRKGEIENCLQYHNQYSCAMPLVKEAEHVLREGSNKASEIYLEILKENPHDLQSKWLLNLAYMTLGKYPHELPIELAIPPKVFESDYEIERFSDIAMNLGIAINEISGSCILEDFNNDGFLDIIATSYDLDDQMRYFENDGNSKFVDKTIDSGLEGLVSGLNCMQTDFNNDGWIDIFVLRGAWFGAAGTHPNSLLKNNGDGTFSDVTISAGIYSEYPTQNAVWADFNNDGWLDVFIGNESFNDFSVACELYINNGDETFKDQSDQLNMHEPIFAKGSSGGDYNNDGWMDLYISNMNGDNVLLKNLGVQDDGRIAFEDVANQAGVITPRASFPCWFFDYNNDGYLDIFVSAFDYDYFGKATQEVVSDYLGKPVSVEMPHLYHNNGNGTFTDISKKMNLNTVLFTMGCNFGDLDNDGFEDFYAATGTPDFRAVFPNRMFRNNAGKHFQDVTTSGGFGHIQKGHGVGFADMDNDGDQDIYCVLGGAYSGDNYMNAFYQNPGNQNSWITVDFEGTNANRAAIGSRVDLYTTTPNGINRIHRQINSGGSFGANSLQLEVGLGKANSVDSLFVKWAGSEIVEKFYDLEVRNFYSIVEAKSITLIERGKIHFNTSHAHH